MRPARSLLLAGASLLLMMAPPALAEPRAPTPAAAIERGLLYAVPDGLPLAMDLARPARTPRGGAPAVVLVHGGGFHSGARGRMRPYLRPLAAAGFVAATIDYRLLPHAEVLDRGLEASSAFAQEDAETAIRFLRENAVRFGIDPQRIVILGASAGGITALNVAARATGPARVQAAVAIAGFGPVADLDGGDPPLLMFHGTADRAAPIARARATCAAARAVGEPCRLVEVPGIGHRALIARHAPISRAVIRWLRARGLG